MTNTDSTVDQDHLILLIEHLNHRDIHTIETHIHVINLLLQDILKDKVTIINLPLVKDQIIEVRSRITINNAQPDQVTTPDHILPVIS
jgi:hypothetical protein